MDLTKLPQELVFHQKESIDDYDIDDDSSADGLLFNRTINYPFKVPFGWDKEKLVLAIFNEANFLSTIIIIDDRFYLHTHSWINYYEVKWGDDDIVSCIFGMVKYYLSNTTGLPNHALKGIDDLIDDYNRTKPSDVGIGFLFYKKTAKPSTLLTVEHFQTVDFTSELLKYNTFKGNVKWAQVTNNFKINDIIKLVQILGKDLHEKRVLLLVIFNDLNSDENEEFCNQEIYEMIQILILHLNTDGVLLTKNDLVNLYHENKKTEEEISQEYYQEEYDRIANSHNEVQKQLEEDFEKQKNQIEQFEKENSELKEQNSILEIKIKDEISKKIKLEAENVKLQERISLLENNRIETAPEEAFNCQTGLHCFTNKQMGIFIRAVSMITETPNPPAKTTLGEVVEKIAGYKAITVNQNMKGATSENDIKVVADAIKCKLPKLAAEVRKL